jgi:hypothetical protein
MMYGATVQQQCCFTLAKFYKEVLSFAVAMAIPSAEIVR